MWSVLVGAASAATWTVGPIGADFTTLTAAVAAVASGDRLEVDAGTYAESVNLSGKSLDIVAVAGATIQPPVGLPAVKYGLGESGLLEGFSLVPSGARAIEIVGGSPVISDCTVTGGGSTILDGGAVKVDGGAPTFSAFTVTGATGLRGGAMYVFDGATVTLDEVTLDGSTGSWGGALYAAGSELTATGLTIADSTAEYSGGAVYLDGATLVATDLSVVEAAGEDSWGACFYLSGSRLEASSGEISACEASRYAFGYSGGAVFADDVSSVVLTDVAIADAAAYAGGGIALDGGSTATLSGVTFAALLATTSGGALSVAGSSTATCTPCTFDDGAAADGGHVHVGPGGSFTAIGGSLTLGVATDEGGALAAAGAASIVLDGVALMSNEAARGGALSLSGVPSAELRASTFDGNVATTGDGGAVLATGTGALTVADARFDRNVAIQGYGGAIASSVPLDVEESAFDANASGRDGGAVHATGTLAFDDVDLMRNTAQGLGGAVCVEGTTATVLRSTFHANTADLGAGLAVVSSTVVAGASIFTENQATDGGGIWLQAAVDAELANLTLLANGATDRGGHLFVDGAPLALINTIAALATDGGGIWAEPSAVAGSDLYHDDVWGNAGGDWYGFADPTGTSGNLAVDPLVRAFTADGDEANDDLHLAPGSPCIDAGIVDRFDPDGTASDIGAYGGPDASTDDDDGDGWLDLTDCDDGDPDRYPGAMEIPYDLVDQDCDGLDLSDLDGDGFDGPEIDCDDEDAAVHPGAAEVWYDGVDQDCAGDSDYDQDQDGHDIVAFGGTDCDDLDPTIHPGVPEHWYDGIDQDCDGGSDYDQDRDGRDAPAGGGEDCDDLDPAVYPGAVELCDDRDQDCDEEVDEDAIDAPWWYHDGDGDGHGDPEVSVQACDRPGGTSRFPDDCDDDDGSVYPGAEEVWYDGVDQDCDGRDDDRDEDGWPFAEDCDDLRAEAYPGAPEQLNGLDDDCDGWAETDDRDGDGLMDVTEWGLGTDPEDPDSDDDGWLDGDEDTFDQDGDGKIGPLDPDDDGDGIPTVREQDVDADGDGLADPDVDRDGIPNGRDTDTDGDGYSDDREGVLDRDGDGVPDFADYTGDFVGGGCHRGDRSVLFLGLLPLFLRRRSVAAWLFASSVAQAQGVDGSGIQVLGTTNDRTAQFRLAPVGAGVEDTLHGEVAVWASGQPLMEDLPDGREPLIGLLGTVTGVVSWAPVDRFRLDATMPWHPISFGAARDSFAVPGDLRLGAGLDLVRPSGPIPGVSVLPSLWVPTGASAAWLGSPTVAGGGVVAIGHEVGPFGWVLNAGARLAPPRPDRGVAAGPGPLVGVGGHWSPGDRLSLVAEVFTHSAVGVSDLPIEGSVLMRARTRGGRVAAIGTSVGLTDGVGSPAWRIVVSTGAGPRPVPRVIVARALEPDPCLVDPASCAPTAVASPVALALAELVDDRIVLREQVFFEEGRADISPDSDDVVAAIAAIMMDHREIDFVLVEGHTNTNGSAAYNQRLSEARAAAVVEWLVAHGVERHRMLSRGYGFSQPLVPYTQPDAWTVNRRVEFVVLRSDEAAQND